MITDAAARPSAGASLAQLDFGPVCPEAGWTPWKRCLVARLASDAAGARAERMGACHDRARFEHGLVGRGV